MKASRALSLNQWAPSTRQLCLLFLVLLLSRESYSESSVTLEVQPTSISITRFDDTVKAHLIFINKGTDVLQIKSIYPITNDGLELVEFQKPFSRVAQPAQTLVWPLTIGKLKQGKFPGSIVFEVVFKAKSSKIDQHAFVALPITLKAEAVAKPVELSVEAITDVVSEQRPGEFVLVMTNNLNVPIRSAIAVSVPGDIFKPPPISHISIPERSTVSTRIEIEAGKQLTPGTYTLVFKLDSDWDSSGSPEHRSIVVTKPAIAGIFFESEVLRALGVPSFLLLPGCLLLFTFQLLLASGLYGLKNDSRIPKIEFSSPGFWILAVSISSLFAIVYYRVTKTDYLLRYGLADLRNVWLASIGLGVVLFVTLGAVIARIRKKKTYTKNDDPLMVLKRLRDNRMSLLCDKVDFANGQVQFEGFIVEKVVDDQQLVWISPPISATWKGSSQTALDAKRDFGQAQSQGTIEEAVQEIETSKKASFVDLEWDVAKSMPCPFHARVDSIVAYKPRDFIVS